MAVTILVPGKVPFEFQGVCDYCGAVLKCLRNDLDLGSSVYEKPSSVKCVACGETWVEMKEVTTSIQAGEPPYKTNTQVGKKSNEL